MRFFLEFSYNGANYHGWQKQTNVISVQEEINRTLSTILNTDIDVVGAGRTDTGVHARKMIAHFDVEALRFAEDDFTFKLNQLLPRSISVISIRAVKDDSHARFDAISRTYYYYIHQVKDPFDYPFHYYYKENLDWKIMNKASKILMNHQDFECFSKSNTDVKTFKCEIEEAFWEVNKNGAVFKIRANRFLRNMVRAIVGTLIEIGLGKKDINDLKQILISKKRSNAGYSVPANGLFLYNIKYPKSIFK